MLGHESAGLTLDRNGHLFESDVEAVGVAINALLIQLESVGKVWDGHRFGFDPALERNTASAAGFDCGA